ncbi:MAG: BatA domain-containing protein [Akkermansiaceae bacterium]
MNPWLLMGAAGVALPIIAHMLNNFRYKKTDWAAMQFLNRSVRVRSSEIRIRDLLLMLIRCLAVLLLILAFTKPALTDDDSFSMIPGEDHAAVIIALDVSFSMQHSDGTTTRLERAYEKIDKIAERITPGSSVSLILLADQHRVVVRNMIYQPEAFAALVREQKIQHESINIDTIPKRLKELCDDVDALQKEVYIVTDLQAKDWKDSSPWLLSAFNDLSEDASVCMVPVEGKSDNVAVTRFELVSGVLRKNTTARYRATVHNYNSQPVSDVRIKCLVDNINVDMKAIDMIPAHASETVSLFVPFNNSGSLRITAALDKDALELDNQRRIVSNIRDKVSVLSVEGSSDSAGASTSFLSKALHAHDSDSSKKDLSIRSIPWVAFPTMNLDDFDVIIISDVPSVTNDLIEKLNVYVRKGNGLIWFAGKNVKLPIWNKQSAKCQPPLLPAEMVQADDVSNDQGAGIALDTVLPDHAVCRPLKSLPEDLLSETRFNTILNIKPHPGSNVVLKLSGSNTPVLIEQSLGRGHVFMFTSSADPSWNNLALTPAFPMLIQQTITYMTGREFEKPRTVGDSLSLIYDDQPDVNDAVFNTPSGETLKVPVREYRNQFVAMIDQSKESGFYTAQVSLQAPAMPIAVNLDTTESAVGALSVELARKSFDGSNITLVSSDAELQSHIDDSRSNRVLWRYLLILGFVLLILESIMAHRMRNKPAPRKEAV